MATQSYKAQRAAARAQLPSRKPNGDDGSSSASRSGAWR